MDRIGGPIAGGWAPPFCEGLVRAIVLGGPSVVGDHWRWCPVALLGAACPRGWKVSIVKMWCLIRAPRM